MSGFLLSPLRKGGNLNSVFFSLGCGVLSSSTAMNWHLSSSSSSQTSHQSTCAGMLHSYHSPADDFFHSLLGSGNSASAPIMESPPPSVSVEDMGIFNVSSFEHEILLPGLDAAAAMALHDDGLAQYEHSVEWSASAEPIFSAGNPCDEHSSMLLPSDVAASCRDAASDSAGAVRGGGSSLFRSTVQLEMRPNLHGGCTKKATSSEKKRSSQLASVYSNAHGLRRSHSANHVRKPSESSENSDAVEDEESDKQGMDTRNSPSKNLVSERRRRKKLNERLYTLRALVPKISKLDKASIVSDAITYVEDLQKQVDKMQADIQALECGKGTSQQGLYSGFSKGASPLKAPHKKPFMEHRILELDISQMEEQTFHLRIHCKKGPGVLVQLTSALEALDLDIINANLTSVNEHVLNSVVVKAGPGDTMTPEELRRRTLDVVPRFGLVM